VGITAALTLAITLKLSRSRSVTPVPPAADASLLARATIPADEYKGGQKETIKVYGHWTIEVRNSDGTLVTHREFEHALNGGGAFQLASLLGRGATIESWQVFVQNGVGNAGVMIEPTSPLPATPGLFKTLIVAVPGNDTNGHPLPNAKKLVLSGTITAQTKATIFVVKTQPEFHCLNVPGVSCFGATVALTSAVLATPVDVVAGQIVQVTAVISFS